MKGIVFIGDKKLEIQDFKDPTPVPNDVITVSYTHLTLPTIE